MQEFAEKLYAPGGALEGAHPWLISVAVMLGGCLIVFLFAAHIAGIYSWFERRFAGRIQSRVGPNRVGPQGFAQWAVDGLKTFQKEDLIPEGADSALFKLAPYVAFAGMFCVFAALPFSSSWVIADFNVAMVYIFAVASVEAIGILLAGWASNSKWSFYGGMRSAAQIISYEIPVGIATLAMVIAAGSLSLQEIVRDQGVNPLDWNLFYSPFAAVAFLCFFTGAIAEINRAPFDLPEAESELVAGFATEYSGLRFLFFFFAEWANIYVISAIATCVFFGGWQVPGLPTERLIQFGAPITYGFLTLTMLGAGAMGWWIAAARDDKGLRGGTGNSVAATIISLALGWGPAITAGVLLWAALMFGVPPGIQKFMANVVQMLCLFAKAHILVVLVIQLRWTLPRLRIDQLMMLCWKYLTPAAFIAVLGNAFWMTYVAPDSIFQKLVRLALFAGFVTLLVIFAMRVARNLRQTRSAVDLKLNV
ncbi:MAG: complex I subunit 1 family protein [Bdellovibrionota bacterium]